MDDPFPVTIYHNPACGTSRNALAMIEVAGHVPTIVDYRSVGWTRPLLEDLLAAMGAQPRDVLRIKGTAAEDLGLAADGVAPEALLDAMVADPNLVNRPIVATPLGTKLCRPSETVLALLPHAPDAFVKEDGEVVRVRP